MTSPLSFSDLQTGLSKLGLTKNLVVRASLRAFGYRRRRGDNAQRPADSVRGIIMPFTYKTM